MEKQGTFWLSFFSPYQWYMATNVKWSISISFERTLSSYWFASTSTLLVVLLSNAWESKVNKNSQRQILLSSRTRSKRWEAWKPKKPEKRSVSGGDTEGRAGGARTCASMRNVDRGVWSAQVVNQAGQGEESKPEERANLSNYYLVKSQPWESWDKVLQLNSTGKSDGAICSMIREGGMDDR